MTTYPSDKSGEEGPRIGPRQTVGHTPGPWRVIAGPHGPKRSGCHVLSTDKRYLADVRSGVDSEANARVMAAGPEMLEALRDAANYLDHHLGSDHPTHVKVLRAIAKAEE